MAKLAVQFDEEKTSKRARGEKTSWYQQEAILQWLEVESNFRWINGEATKGMKVVSKASALQNLADFVNNRCRTRWHKDKARETLRTYKTMRSFNRTRRITMILWS